MLVAALYQATAPKRRFLLDCRARAAATSGEGAAEAFIAGTRYGRSCMGSSALLMLLLFVAGVMNLAAMLALGAWVAIEKLPRPAPRAASKPL